MTVLLPLLLAFLAAPVTALSGAYRARWAAPTGIIMAGLAFVATLWGWLAGGGAIEIPWAPTWDLHLSVTFDGLAALYALLATGIGFAVLVYSSGYLPRHLQHEERPIGDAIPFYTFLLLFMGSMVGLVMAQDLLLLFIFWDLTAIASYYLIAYDRNKAEARESALMAFLVTGVASVLFLIGALLLYADYQTFSLPTLIQRIEPGTRLTLAGALMALAALAKSAQVPFHFWLPRAMVAPTPVSAYLHSAAMVAAGVFLLQRLYPLLQTSPLLLDALLAIGLLSMAIGGVLALTQDVLKRVLAYSTIAQYGYVVFMLGLGGSAGAAGASFYVIAHALIKSALFLTAGAVTEATDETKLSRLGGLARSMPLLAIGCGAAAAGLAALPLTIGFFKDELLFKAALERGWPFAILAALSAALTLAYIWRFWRGIFLGERQSEVQPIPAALVAPVAGLGLLVVAGGIIVAPFARLAEAAGTVTFGAPTPVELAYHLDARPENLLAIATYVLGILLIYSRPFWSEATKALARAGEQLGPEKWYTVTLDYLDRFSDWMNVNIVPDLAGRIATILVPTAILLAAGLLAANPQNVYTVGAFSLTDLPLTLALLLTAVATLIVILPKRHLTQVLALSSVSYSLAAVYAFFGAPDVALVMVLIGTLSTLFFLGVLVLLPGEALEREATRPVRGRSQVRDTVVSIIAGTFAFIVAWGVLSQPAAGESVATEQARLAPAAHAGDVVTAILADFRGLDTMGEITVIAIALVGIFTLLGRGKL